MIKAIMYFVERPGLAANWWADAFDTTAVHEGSFSYVHVEGLEIGFHPNEDGRNPKGSSTVAYLSTPDLEASRAHFLERGCAMHRGPLTISPTRTIVQLTDPFGNVFGLDGP
jgi:predicted enzyme related to lactoylglutathione lyase